MIIFYSIQKRTQNYLINTKPTMSHKHLPYAIYQASQLPNSISRHCALLLGAGRKVLACGVNSFDTHAEINCCTQVIRRKGCSKGFQ